MPGCLFLRGWMPILLSWMLFPMMSCNRVFYYPDRKDRGSPAEHSLAFEEVFFKTEGDQMLHGWFLPAASGKPTRGTVLHLHGNAANITGHYEFARWLPAEGYNLLVFDYRGYGRSEGHVTRDGTIQDAMAALDYLRERGDLDSDRILVWGQSIGGAISVVLTAERRNQIRGLAVEAGFSCYRGIVRHHALHHPLLLVLAWWFPFLIDQEWCPIDYVDQVSPVPVFFIHGTTDRVVPCRMSQAMHDRAKPPKELWLIEGMDHYEVWQAQPEVAKRRLLEFFERTLEGPTGKAPAG